MITPPPHVDRAGVLRLPGGGFRVSVDYLILRACERLGGAVTLAEAKMMPPRDLAKLIAYHTIREAASSPSP